MVLNNCVLYWLPKPGQEGEISYILTLTNNDSGAAYSYVYPVNTPTVNDNPPAFAFVSVASALILIPNAIFHSFQACLRRRSPLVVLLLPLFR